MESVLYSMLAGVLLMAGFALFAAVLSAVVVAGYKFGIYWLAAIVVVISAVVTTFTGLMGGLCVLLVLLMFSYAQTYCMTQKIGLVRSVAISMVVLIVGLVVSYFILKRSYSEVISEMISQYMNDITEYIKEYVTQVIDPGDMDIAELAREYIIMTVPTVIIVPSLVVSLTVYSMSASFVNKVLKANVPYVKFRLWALPPKLGCTMSITFFVVMMVSMLNVPWANALLVLCMCLYILWAVIVGMGSIMFFQNCYRMPDAAAWVVLAILLSAAPVLVIIVGIIDRIFRLRVMYMIKHKMIKIDKKNINITGMNANDMFSNPFNGFKESNDDVMHNHNDDEKDNDMQEDSHSNESSDENENPDDVDDENSDNSNDTVDDKHDENENDDKK